jgi:transcriptional regulator with AAA-type ATPase domain
MVPNAASKSRIPRRSVRLTVNQLAYDTWAKEFDEMIEYFETVYELYRLARVQLEKHMQLARKKNWISGSASRDLLDLYWRSFLMEMSR